MEIKIITTEHPLYRQVLDLRDRILRRPLGLSVYQDDLSGEAGQIIFAGVQAGEVIACGMLKQEGKGLMKLRQMAVDTPWQGKGLGNLILAAAEGYARQNGARQISLHARKYAAPFYEKAGYRAAGATFEEVGLPHLAMSKQLDQ